MRTPGASSSTESAAFKAPTVGRPVEMAEKIPCWHLHGKRKTWLPTPSHHAGAWPQYDDFMPRVSGPHRRAVIEVVVDADEAAEAERGMDYRVAWGCLGDDRSGTEVGRTWTRRDKHESTSGSSGLARRQRPRHCATRRSASATRRSTPRRSAPPARVERQGRHRRAEPQT